MWEVPRYRIKAYLRQLRRGHSSSDTEARPRFHFMKTRGQIVITEGAAYQSDIIDCSIVLNDLNAMGVLLFSSKSLLPGQTVNLTIQHPKLFYIKGIITSCTQILRPQAVISTASYPYRVYIRFQLKGFEELVVVRNYCHEIKTNLLAAK